ncbi:ABC transporter permease [Clostridium boliviensis]|uniref:Transport permease protein n=1 Tax=Clostridium boliviensis TaxID=318465 RepID=A0ABU4GPY8_9CLOT|nr:ABC transporter permease [Clostridium boliviensis]MDW2799679.1 ABC transporter permease [Clostridium boliviensis]
MNYYVRKIFHALIFCLIIAIVFQWAGGDELKYRAEKTPMIELNNVLPEIIQGTTIDQELTINCDSLDRIILTISNYGRITNKGLLTLELIDGKNRQVLADIKVDVSNFKADQTFTWNLSKSILDMKNKKVILRATSNSESGSGLSLYFLQDNLQRENQLYLNGEPINGVLSFSLEGRSSYWFGVHYWHIIIALLGYIILYYLTAAFQESQGRLSMTTRISKIWKRYEFLIKQLVSRDFKTKYKRSILGYLWSLLNPLLSMVVQYIVFSTIFRQDIDNFPVYLLSGIVMFNFFVDAVGQGLNAILCNASLITKVYVPKYIYPVTKVLSCSINLFISIIPLLVVMIITGENFTKALVLIVFPLAWVLIFSIGLALILSAAMVFFRDTQYLWGIFSLIWTYATPLFYPAKIIPPQYAFILKINPMYYYISFLRELLIAGRSPGLYQYVLCSFSAIVVLCIGTIVFKKTQDKFILYI